MGFEALIYFCFSACKSKADCDGINRTFFCLEFTKFSVVHSISMLPSRHGQKCTPACPFPLSCFPLIITHSSSYFISNRREPEPNHTTQCIPLHPFPKNDIFANVKSKIDFTAQCKVLHFMQL